MIRAPPPAFNNYARNAIYTDLSAYYDLMCPISITAPEPSAFAPAEAFPVGGKRHLDLACGNRSAVRYFLVRGYQSSWAGHNQPMAGSGAGFRCPEAQFSLQDM